MVAPLYLLPAWMKRAALVKETGELKKSLSAVENTVTSTKGLLKNKNLLKPGLAIGATGVVGGAAVTNLPPKAEPNVVENLDGMNLYPSRLNNIPNFTVGNGNSAEFFLGIAAGVENTIASMIIGAKNNKLKKKIADASIAAQDVSTQLMKSRRNDKLKLGAIGVGSAGIGLGVGATLKPKKLTPEESTKLNDIFYPGDGKLVRKMSPEQHTQAKEILNYNQTINTIGNFFSPEVPPEILEKYMLGADASLLGLKTAMLIADGRILAKETKNLKLEDLKEASKTLVNTKRNNRIKLGSVGLGSAGLALGANQIVNSTSKKETNYNQNIHTLGNFFVDVDDVDGIYNAIKQDTPGVDETLSGLLKKKQQAGSWLNQIPWNKANPELGSKVKQDILEMDAINNLAANYPEDHEISYVSEIGNIPKSNDLKFLGRMYQGKNTSTQLPFSPTNSGTPYTFDDELTDPKKLNVTNRLGGHTHPTKTLVLGMESDRSNTINPPSSNDYLNAATRESISPNDKVTNLVYTKEHGQPTTYKYGLPDKYLTDLGNDEDTFVGKANNLYTKIAPDITKLDKELGSKAPLFPYKLLGAKAILKNDQLANDLFTQNDAQLLPEAWEKSKQIFGNDRNIRTPKEIPNDFTPNTYNPEIVNRVSSGATALVGGKLLRKKINKYKLAKQAKQAKSINNTIASIE